MGKTKKKGKHGQNRYSHLEEDETSLVLRKTNGKKTGSNGQQRRDSNSKHKSGAGCDDYRFRASVEDDTRCIVDIAADGNCLFRSLSDQLYYDHGDKHEEVRSEICDYIEAKEEEFRAFLVLDETEEDEDAANFEEYISKMRNDGEWGGNLELVAASQFYRRNIKVFSVHAAFTIEHGAKKGAGRNLMVSYHENDHYNSVREHSVNRPPPPDKFPIETQGKVAPAVGNVEPEMINETTSTGAVNASLKKNNPCYCGSGFRYKKCCLVTDKRRERLEKSRAKHGRASGHSEAPAHSDEESSVEIDGQFTMLKI